MKHHNHFHLFWSRNGGLTVAHQEENHLEGHNLDAQDKIQSNSSGNLGIRYDWDILQSISGLRFEDEPQIMKETWIWNPELSKYIAIQQNSCKKLDYDSYETKFCQKLRECYPNDQWGIFFYDFTVENTPFSEIERQLRKTFHPHMIGTSFISHAHADHCPSTISTSTIKFQPKSEDKSQKSLKIYPFPIFSTPLTIELLKLRFGIHFLDATKNLPKLLQTSNSSDSAIVNSLHQYAETYLQRYPSPIMDSKDMQTYLSREYFQGFDFGKYCGWFIPNGHVIGSAGLCLRTNEGKNLEDLQKSKIPFAECILLGESTAIARPHTFQTPPIRCGTLIIDGLFADPRLLFPDPVDEMRRISQWLSEELQSHPVIFFCHDLGKPQLLSALLQNINKTQHTDYSMVVPEATRKLFSPLIDRHFQVPNILAKSVARKQKIQQNHNFLLVVPSSERHSSSLNKLIESRKAVTAEITGWCHDTHYCETHRADAYFTLSDHMIFPELVAYLNRCEINEIQIIQDRSGLVAAALQNEGFSAHSEVNFQEIFEGMHHE